MFTKTTRLQVQRQLRAQAGTEGDDDYKDIVDAARKIYNDEGGIKAFYAGIGQDLAKGARRTNGGEGMWVPWAVSGETGREDRVPNAARTVYVYTLLTYLVRCAETDSAPPRVSGSVARATGLTVRSLFT